MINGWHSDGEPSENERLGKAFDFSDTPDIPDIPAYPVATLAFTHGSQFSIFNFPFSIYTIAFPL